MIRRKTRSTKKKQERGSEVLSQRIRLMDRLEVEL
jgi:hypothetical protein